jgi:cell shape-determining protein MreC
MTYLQRNRKTRGDKKRILLIVSIVILLVVLFFAGNTVRDFVQSVGRPILILGEKISSPLSVIPDYFKTKVQLVDDNEELIKENKKFKIELLTINELKKENEDLKNILNYSETPEERMLARVISRPPLSPFDTFIIDLGEQDISVGASVFHSNIHIGEVEEVFSSTSTVRLISSPNQNSFVDIGSDIHTEAKGIGNGSFVVSVPKDVLVEVGDVVSFVNNGVLGPVEAVEIDHISTFQNVYFSFPFSPQEIDWVEVAK